MVPNIELRAVEMTAYGDNIQNIINIIQNIIKGRFSYL